MSFHDLAFDIILREGDPKGWSTLLVTALDSWEKLVLRGHALIASEHLLRKLAHLDMWTDRKRKKCSCLLGKRRRRNIC
jgi:hypothetical protein